MGRGFDSDQGAISDFERVFGKVGAVEVCLKEGRHVGVTWAGVGEDVEMGDETGDVDCYWEGD